MDFSLIAWHGTMYGLVLSISFTLIFLAAAMLNPEILLNDYPPDVKVAYGGEQNPKTRGQKRVVSLLMLGTIFGVITWSVVNLVRAFPTPLTFLPILLLIFIEVFTFNLWDLLVIDWLVFNTLQPKFIFLPGTEGMPGYKSYSFHFKGFLTGIMFNMVSSLVLAGMTVMIVNSMR